VIKILTYVKWEERKGKFDILWRDNKEAKALTKWMEELVDKGNWTIIAATTEYIILQKKKVQHPEDFKVRVCLKCGKEFVSTKGRRHCFNCMSKNLIKGDVIELPSIEGAEEPDTPQ